MHRYLEMYSARLMLQLSLSLLMVVLVGVVNKMAVAVVAAEVEHSVVDLDELRMLSYADMN